MGYFKGLGELFSPQQTGQLDRFQQYKIFPGQVIEICLDETSPLFESTRDVGKIQFRDLTKEYNKTEDLVVKQAYPLDRSFARYPYPGEEVLIYRAIGETSAPQSLVLANIYFYSFVVSAHHNITYNQNPFLGTDKAHIDPSNIDITYETAKARFEKKTKGLDNVRELNGSQKIYKQLQPQEGDFILQGRFGNSIRLGSTSPNNNSFSWNSTGVAGDGIMVWRVDRDYSVDEKSMMTSEDINTDDASIYMCSSQNIELSLACTKSMKSWAARYGLANTGTEQAEGTVSKNKDTSALWQKVIDTSKPVSQTYKSINTDGGEIPSDLPNNTP